MRSFFVFLACLSCTTSAQLVTKVEERAAPATSCTTTAIPTPTNVKACGSGGRLKTPQLIAQSPAVNQTVCRDKCIPDKNCNSFAYNAKNKVCKTFKGTLTAQGYVFDGKQPLQFWDKACFHVQCCTAPKSICGDTCANLKNDNNNCGTCSNSCFNGTSCKAGKCVCPAGQTKCGESCVNLLTSADNCGTCGNKCPTGSSCVNGKCGCPAGSDLCNGRCVQIGTDDHCSACNDSCNLGFSCRKGKCECTETTETVCNGVCYDLMTDYKNCGKCGNECLYNGYCSSGTCHCPTEGEVYCDGIFGCHNLATDTYNCGICGNACPDGQICDDGACRCPDGFTFCDGRCVDTNRDYSNCGTCGNKCGRSNEFCDVGECKCPRRGTYGFPTTPCADRCVELDVDTENCHACGNKCGPDQECGYTGCVDKYPNQNQ